MAVKYPAVVNARKAADESLGTLREALKRKPPKGFYSGPYLEDPAARKAKAAQDQRGEPDEN
jgi:hypothetical protein